MYAAKNHEFEIRYDNIESCKLDSLCEVKFKLDFDLVNPKLYYKFENFYANHR